jgi:RNA polymerase sigma-70 factor (ECF subfamily)
LLAWLLDHARKQITTRHRRALRARAALLAPVAEPGDAAGVIERLDLLDALKHLTPQQQDVIILRYFMAKTTPEIAAIMGRNQNAVFALQFRAVRSLRRYLAEDATSQVWRTEAGGS